MSSFFWEYGVEAFAERPSMQDLYITPIAGYLIREGFFIAKKAIIKNDSRILHSRFLGYTTLFVLDPFNNILDGLGYKQKVKPQITLKPVFFNPNTTRASWALNISANF